MDTVTLAIVCLAAWAIGSAFVLICASMYCSMVDQAQERQARLQMATDKRMDIPADDYMADASRYE